MRDDEKTKLLKWTFRTSGVACCLASFQLIVNCLSLAQHIYSLVIFQHIFICRFNQTEEENLPKVNVFLQADFVIYDFGLYYHLWNISKCIANYMDGGYCRFLWTLGYILAVALLFLSSKMKTPHPYMLYPMLAMQSTYCIGMLILTFSALPKLLKIIFSSPDGMSIALILAFVFGTGLNFFLNYLVWHFYWYIENAHRKREPFNSCNRAKGMHRKAKADAADESDMVVFSVFDSETVGQQQLHNKTAGAAS